MSDLILRSTGKIAELRFVAADLTDTVNDILKLHQAEGGLAVLMSDTLLASIFISSGVKLQGSIRLEAEFDGVLKNITAESTPMGLARAKFEMNDAFKGDPNSELKPDVMKVKKFDVHNKVLSEGIVPMDGLSMGKNLTGYLLQSEQIKSAVSIVTRLDPNDPSKVLFAAGYLVEAFPKCDEKTLSIIEQVILNFPDFSTFYHPDDGFKVKDMLDELAGPFEYEIHREMVPAHFKINDRDNCRRALLSLGAVEISNLIEANEDIEMVDEYSKDKYIFTLSELNEILEEIKNK
jgi:molecular chaperone Hsp33